MLCPRLPLAFFLCCSCVSILSLLLAVRAVAHSPAEVGAIDLLSTIIFNNSSPLAPVCRDLEPKQIDFTLVTQLSVSRLPVMKEQCRRWGNHPISVAIASPVSKPAIERALTNLGCHNVILSVVIVGKDEPYPVNKLRNLALSKIRTSHAFYVDVDFLVSPNLYQSLLDQRSKLLYHRDAVVVPVLELRPLCPTCQDLHQEIIPETKTEAFELYSSTDENAAVKQFDYKNPGGHNSTGTEEWFQQRPNTLQTLDCISSDRYEPYLAMRYCRDMPPFQEVFTGYGQNKVTWARHLIRTGYRFHRLSDGFAIHFPHSKSKDSKRWGKIKTSKGRDALEVTKLSNAFTEWLETTVADKRVMPSCFNSI